MGVNNKLNQSPQQENSQYKPKRKETERNEGKLSDLLGFIGQTHKATEL